MRYHPGQHYNSHMDTFDAKFLSQSTPEFGQRMATFIMYLSDVEEGGETVFKHEGKYGKEGPYDQCAKHIPQHSILKCMITLGERHLMCTLA